MTKNNFVSVASFIFLVVGVLHVLRLLNGWEVQIGGFVPPMWASWVALILAAYLALQGFRLARKP
ncbi:hypothetical protein A3I95_02995 [Candidatus Nomurabacteria bacterium RIFCSPLOWO2_02_FULL_44_12]|uniref:Uncharacterized protein n=1 Tax=Candidatus Nomurabacteria bacterium RIFCSPLOWO2_12_FULL_44_11 TaxID=1801796 RepID=A0A1F6Y3R6_9BACT|nr:MAG: hypothetical protein A3E95_00230 [Candidatus Nomurabacteria bacterium RIFCSPHIGHO2_12_FULL_44_22b]OGJ00982.1 MAG: hypothetical protein A3G53_02955 [Candidatus Nomurabacteria bacterium RIFCSPLOWO2_12_FULL_44_11]OGJ08233.1 MAG: hypothetical protein A3I95_02995 [Candidatus Nomurabacteria bacterium RIFCSPLOWO2_02_FULL_44_12]